MAVCDEVLTLCSSARIYRCVGNFTWRGYVCDWGLKVVLRALYHLLYHTSLNKTQTDRLESIQRRALRPLHPDLSYAQTLSLLGIHTLHERREQTCRAFFQNIMNSSHRLHYLLPKKRTHVRNLRHQKPYQQLRCRTTRYQNSLVPYGLSDYQ